MRFSAGRAYAVSPRRFRRVLDIAPLLLRCTRPTLACGSTSAGCELLVSTSTLVTTAMPVLSVLGQREARAHALELAVGEGAPALCRALVGLELDLCRLADELAEARGGEGAGGCGCGRCGRRGKGRPREGRGGARGDAGEGAEGLPGEHLCGGASVVRGAASSEAQRRRTCLRVRARESERPTAPRLRCSPCRPRARVGQCSSQRAMSVTLQPSSQLGFQRESRPPSRPRPATRR